MFSMPTRTHVTGLSGREITDFLSTCTDQAFANWWPGTHFHLHTVKGTSGSVGSIIFMEEMIGGRRIKVTCELVELVPGRTLVWQLRRPLFRLPVRLILQLKDDDTGVAIEQSIEAGFSGRASCLDPVFRVFFRRALLPPKTSMCAPNFPNCATSSEADAGIERLCECLASRTSGFFPTGRGHHRASDPTRSRAHLVRFGP